jgi:hypothetical protein
MEQHLKAFLESFLAKRYKKQWIETLLRTKSDCNLIQGMDALHRELDERYCTQLPKGSKQQDIVFIRKAIASYKLSACWVLSAHKDFNRQFMLIEDALNNVVGSSSTTLISFLPGNVVYFEGHSVGERYRYLCIKEF